MSILDTTLQGGGRLPTGILGGARHVELHGDGAGQ